MRRRWAALLAASLLFAGVGEALHLPASLLLGPMAASVLLASRGHGVAVARPVFLFAQAVIGCLVARALPIAIFQRLGADAVLTAATILSVVLVSVALGLLLTRLRALPGTTAIWGAMPGAANAMVLMAGDFGADARLVAFMQYLRVVTVAATASVVAALVGAGGAHAGLHLFAPVRPSALALTLLLAVAAAIVGPRSRLPAGPLLLALGVGTLAQDAAGLRIELPPLLLAASYAVMGWTFGARFTGEILARAVHALPVLFLSTVVLIAVCAGFGAAVSRFAHVDPLTAFLATSPGGADAIAVIASNSRVDVPFVMAMQAGRFLFVLAVGPALARLLAGRSRVPRAG